MDKFWKAAIIRAVRTIAQTAVATIGTAAVLEAVDWRMVISASILAGLLSVLTSIATGLPEAEEEKDGQDSGTPEPDREYQDGDGGEAAGR